MKSRLTLLSETKTNSQELEPVERVSWSITGWKRQTYLEAINKNVWQATYYGKIGTFPVGRMAGHVIKNERKTF